MTTKTTKVFVNLDVSSWLVELHMECYKKNLENYETIKPLLELRDPDIKKLGVVNSTDRRRMMNSLAKYKSKTQQGSVAPAGPVSQVQESHKSLLRKSSLKKLNIKSFLTSGTSKKNKSSKKMAGTVQITELSLPAASELGSEETGSANQSTAVPIPSSAAQHSTLPASLPQHTSAVPKPLSPTSPDYEELPDVVSPLSRSMTMEAKSFQVPRQSVVENEYVPSPENSPKFGGHRHRAYTTAASFSNLDHYSMHRGGVAAQYFNPEMMGHQFEQYGGAGMGGSEDDAPGQLMRKHLSIVSMESGLSFGYDVEKDFNPSQPLEAQPWFHGKIQRTDAEALLHDDGDFLVRENTSVSNTFTLTLRWRGVADHTLIGTTEVISTTSVLRGSAVKYQFDSGAFDSIPELIYNHLKYQIPIDVAQHTLITNPVCRPGSNQGKGIYTTNLGVYTPITVQRSSFSPESSPASASSHRRSGSPAEMPHHHSSGRLGRPVNINMSPSREGSRISKKFSSSSGDLLEASREEVDVSLRNVISPPPDIRGRAMTVSHPGLRQFSSASAVVQPKSVGAGEPGNHQRMDSFGDYEVMESVSILKESPSLSTRKPHPPQSTEGQAGWDYQRQSLSAGNTLNRPPYEKVKYAEIHYPKNNEGGPGVIVKSGSNSVNYAEVRFPRSNTASTSSRQPHPFALYDMVPPGRREATPPRNKQETGPYQSRAEVMTPHLHVEPTYSIPATVGRRLGSGSARPVSNYATIQFPLQRNNTPSTHGHAQSHSSSIISSPQSSGSHVPIRHQSHSSSSVSSPQSSGSHVPIQQTDTSLYALPNKSRLSPKPREVGSSTDSLPGSNPGSHSASPIHKHVMGASLVHSHATSAKVHKNLPGYEALVKVHTLLQNHSNEELAYHMTRTDAVSFMLTPRPGEDKDIWKDRVQQVTSSSGMFCGLQTLADPDGEKLWKKLYYRHLNLSQTVTLAIITAGDALERTKLLHRYINVAHLLQSEKYGNLFSFVAVMQGLAAPQLSEAWELLNIHYSEEAATYKMLQSTITAIDQGEAVLSQENLTIPPIQHLKAVFHFTEQNMVGFAPFHREYSIMGEFLDMTMGMEVLRTIIANSVAFTVNAWRKLEGLQYNVNLMEFLTQDFTRVYLQAINVQSDDPLERRRRFGLLMDALIDRVQSSESV